MLSIALKRRRYINREKRELPWDWHAWNLLLVSTPPMIFWAYLYRVEQIMIEEHRIREATAGRTGVGGRAYMAPGGKGGQVVRGMLEKGNVPLRLGGTTQKREEMQEHLPETVHRSLLLSSPHVKAFVVNRRVLLRLCRVDWRILRSRCVYFLGPVSLHLCDLKRRQARYSERGM